MKTFGLLFISFLITNCGSTNIEHQNSIFWIHSAKAVCIGVGKTTCFQIQRGNTVDINKDWNLFYSQIIGFEYQPGFIYKLRLKVETIENPPADGSSIKYTLIEVLEKNKDTRYNIHDIYILRSIDGEKMDFSNLKKHPSLEINITKMMIIGNNGCNNYSGSITALSKNNISFGPLAETKMLCANMEIPTLFSNGISRTASFKKDEQGLHFIDTTNKTVLSFKKID